MKKITGIIGFLMIPACMQLTSAVEDELIFAPIVYRHGNRTIEEKTFPNDPNINPIFWPEGFYALTNIGKKVHYELGRYLRRRYNDLIGPGYNPKKVYIRSTDTDRTVMSAQANCAGLFEPTENEKWNESINWQPVAIHTVPITDDYLVYQSIPCDKVDKMLNEFIESEAMTAFLDQYNHVLKYMEENTGEYLETNNDKISGLHRAYDAMTIESARGLTLPDWAQHMLKFESKRLGYLSPLHFALRTRTPEMKKAKTGFIIREIFDRFRNKTLSLLDPELKMYTYSAHDNTIACILNAMNIYDMNVPPYAASLHFELRKNNDEYYVQLFYRTDNSEYIPPMEIPKCGTKCPLSKLYELYKDIIPTEDETYESLCRL